MDYIDKYDIELDKEHYRAGEIINGRVALETNESIKVTCIQVHLRGRAHVEWRVTRCGERRTVKGDQSFIDEKVVVWGSQDLSPEECTPTLLPKGNHRLPFKFQLPKISLPCSFESRIGTIRYYLRVVIDTPYASPPQGLKYFNVIGPSIDCLDDQYTTPLYRSRHLQTNFFQCCKAGSISIEACLEKRAYCCHEKIKLMCEIQNESDNELIFYCQLIQVVQFRINRSEIAITKEIRHCILEHSNQLISRRTYASLSELSEGLQLPVVPPTLTNVCKVTEINYILKMGLCGDRLSEEMTVELPIIITSEPSSHRTINNDIPVLDYKPADNHVEGGIYVSPEFLLGQVYDGEHEERQTGETKDSIILFRPSYVCIVKSSLSLTEDEQSVKT
ncbi:hypothetical protein HELRODRAFT_115644 [Helobdella robusta]|uniref:Arrestin C-terminal-like domain-containing protein n=1 Tax=Helobdella robusta TaxID=6412 RepID=T1EG97_HELRO|nr:hypothetical protein HELRODRAFT_115644 [Helobdella robusta]ESN93407.1 hypothetical protein HELRODRAFT_115644 [Helobdella robusta]